MVFPSRNRDLVFWDTSAFIALLVARDRYHQQAMRIRAELRRQRAPVFTTDAVLTETANGLASPAFRSLMIPYLGSLLRDAANGRATIVHVDQDLWEQGWALYRSRADKGWGHTDCVSFVVMQVYGLTHAFTSDAHFEQAGFTRLMTGEDES